MKITLGKYICGHCGQSFEAPLLDESSYGEFLLWSSAGNVAYLNAIGDNVYSEVDDLLSQLFEDFKADPFKSSEVLQNIFGPMACDPDPTGAPYMINAQPQCPVCSNSYAESWELISPPQIVDYDISIVTHVKWDRLNVSEKIDLIKRFISENSSMSAKK